MSPIEELSILLRPAGGGLHLVSTGRDAQEELQRRLYGVEKPEDVAARFRDALMRIQKATVAILGVPSDVGAGFVRGANLGPQAIRSALLDRVPNWRDHAQARGILDIGDVFVVPQLLHDSMLGAGQLEASRLALYPNVNRTTANTLPVSPLSIAERALDLVFQLNPEIKPFVLGGDHSVAWAVTSAIARARGSKRDWGIVQPDAHTDLLAERLGIQYCFATWSYHANDVIGRGGRLVQVGTRASRFAREHWEKTLDVRQFWADECRANPDGVIDEVIAHLKRVGVSGVYFSNDIDGTDAEWADATGTPEPEGLTREFVVALIRRLARDVGLIAADIMEVAPPLVRSEGGVERTLATAVDYVQESLDALTAS